MSVTEPLHSRERTVSVGVCRISLWIVDQTTDLRLMWHFCDGSSRMADMSSTPLSADFTNGHVSRWYADIGLPTPGPRLPGTREADVCIVGAGYTGLWTAYYLKQAQPDLRIAVLEREFAGFGASGRNGGWLSAELAGKRDAYAATHGHQGVVDLMRAMRGAVDEV